MEKGDTTYNSFSSRIFIIQPIHQSKQAFEHFVLNKNNKKRLCEKSVIVFDYETRFDSSLGVKENSVNYDFNPKFTLMVKSAFDEHKDTIDFLNYYVPDKSSVFIKHDAHGLITIIYDLVFDYDKSQFDEFSKDSLTYLKMRYLFVNDNENKKSKFIEEIEKNTFDFIFGNISNSNIKLDDFSIEDNSGNMLHIVHSNEYKENENLISFLKNSSMETERIKYKDSIIKVEGTTFYYTGGRIHSLIVKNKEDVYRFFPIHFYGQFIYNFLARFYRYLENQLSLNKKIKDTFINDSMKSIQVLDSLNYLKIYNSLFMTKIEADREDIYSVIDKHWNLTNLLETTDLYMKNFEDLLRNSYEIQKMKGTERQNFLLYVLSGLQILGLIGVWTSFLGFFERDSERNSFFLWLINSIDKMYFTYIFITILFITTILWLTVFRKTSK